VEGWAHVDDPRHPYVVVSNHQSTIDIPLISRLPIEMKWVVKKELMAIPGFGWMMQVAGDIPVDRADPESRSSVLTRARTKLDRRCSVMLFPEGTRSRDGRLLRYADGAFRLAIQAGVPVLPLVVEGTLDALPKNDWRFKQRAHLRLKVLPPVPTTGLTPNDAPALRKRVRDQTAAQLAAWRNVPVAAVDSQSPPPPSEEVSNKNNAS
ncbi:MAG: 1-acylglycerol-3-phosphate O-acyltransferase, partial [Bacteroidetes bacterium]|jgi:1-acyl-sn-glycerol-3-phosphate acyltransferase|nr:1-acylglycerol-3-phosphate O-acyltransferase [Bacteroidota bacterium]